MCVYLLIYYAVMSSMIAAFYVISQFSSPATEWGCEPTTEWGREPTRMHEIMFLMH